MVSNRPYLIKWDGINLGWVDVELDLTGLNITAIEIREAYKQYLNEE